jgi:hypothetical protein
MCCLSFHSLCSTGILTPYHGQPSLPPVLTEGQMPHMDTVTSTPGAYWFQSEVMTCQVLADVHLKDGDLIAW